MKFLTAYAFTPFLGEKLSQDSLIDLSGYVPTEKRISNIMKAGHALTQVLSGQFDYADDPGENWDVDPTRSGNFDLVDAQRGLERGVKAEDTLKRAQEALRKAQEAVKQAKQGSTNPHETPAP